MKKYRVVITEIDETGKETVEHDREYKGLTMLADNVEGEGFTEFILHDNLMNIAAKMGSSIKCCAAAKIVAAIEGVRDKDNGKMESALLDAIIGGETNG